MTDTTSAQALGAGLAGALGEFTALLGSDRVIADDRTLREWRDPFAHETCGDGACLRFRETIKDALDPHGILAPGKQGIWPRSMRAER